MDSLITVEAVSEVLLVGLVVVVVLTELSVECVVVAVFMVNSD